MPKRVDVFYSLVSPWTYLGWSRFRAIAKRHGAEAQYKPVDLGKIFPQSGGLPLAKRPRQRQDYRMMELKRWRDFLDLPLNLSPKFFPANENLAARMVVACRLEGNSEGAGALSGAILKAVWTEDRNIADETVLMAIADQLSLNGKTLRKLADNEHVAKTYDADTEEANRRGVFGVPSFLVGDEIFWGQDRLDFLDRALAKG